MNRFGFGFLGQQSRRFVVKRTFLDVIDSPVPAEFTLGGGLRVRASSDSDLYEKFEGEARKSADKSPDPDKPEDENETELAGFELCSLSDTETMSLEPSESGTACDSPSTPRNPQSDAEVGNGSKGDVRTEQSNSAHSHCAPPTTQANVDYLLSENRRLQMENRLLQERAVETSAIAVPHELSPWVFPPCAMGFVAVPCPVGVWNTDGQTPPHAPPRGAQMPARRQQAGLRKAGARTDCASSSGTGGAGRRDMAEDGDGTRTTVMLRNLPNNYTRSMLLGMLDEEGFAGLYNFVYLPIDFKSSACLGYAFVNLVDTSTVPHFWRTFDGYCSWILPSKKVCHVSWSGPHQGLQAHIDRYRNSPIMHSTVPDECKPILFQDGVRASFPAPTKTTRAPRIRNLGAKAGNGGGQACRPHFDMRQAFVGR